MDRNLVSIHNVVVAYFQVKAVRYDYMFVRMRVYDNNQIIDRWKIEKF